MRAHAIPQNLMSVEFKLFGELTIRQFIYIATGSSISYLLYMGMTKGYVAEWISWPLIILFGGGGALIALVPVNDIYLDKWIVYYFNAIRSPTRRTWKKNKKGERFDPKEAAKRKALFLQTHPMAKFLYATVVKQQKLSEQELELLQKMSQVGPDKRSLQQTVAQGVEKQVNPSV